MLKSLLAASLLALAPISAHAQQSPALGAPVVVTVDRSKSVGTSRLELGVTHTQAGLDTGGDAAALQRGKGLIASVARFHNVHIMGWGALNPNPAPGSYDWASLDRRMEMVLSVPGAEPVITLCAAPDWMKGGQPGETDWSKIEVAPRPEHFADFAKLAAAVARRYPRCQYFQVWNEMKGLWSARLNTWDTEKYTALYNQVYDALKAVDPQIKVGGPYLVVEGTGSGREGFAAANPLTERDRKVIQYWLDHKRGADFITLDRSVTSFHDKSLYTTREKMELARWFEGIAAQVRAMTPLPLWWAEYYAETPDGDDAVAVLHAVSLLHMARGGTSNALLWQPMQAGEVSHALFTDARKAGGGQALPLHRVFQIFHDDFAPGTRLFEARSASPDVEALASERTVLLVNKSEAPQDVVVEGRKIALGAHQVLALALPAKKQN